MKKIFKMLLVVVLVAFSAGSAFAATFSLNVDSLTFNADDKQDIIGAGTLQTADGTTDASFTLKVSGSHAIKDISLTNETTGKAWSTSPSGTTGLLLVKDSEGKALNTSGSLPILPVLRGTEFKLYINDASGSIPRDSTFAVSVTLVDRSVITGKTAVNSSAPVEQATLTSNGDGIIDLVTSGLSGQDLANGGEKVGADGKNDFQLDVKLNFHYATIRGIKLKAVSGRKNAEWDTMSGNKLPIITVVDSNNNIINKTNGSVEFTVKGTSSYILLVQDTERILSASDVKAKLTISLSDGRMFERDAVRGQAISVNDSLSVEYKGTGKYDFVGNSEKIESNFNADRQIDITLNTEGTITGIRVQDTKSGKVWDTAAGNSNPLIAVTNEKGERQNKTDGSVSLPIIGSKNLTLWIDEENDKRSGPYNVTLVFSNGQVLEASTAKSNDQKTSNVTKTDRAVRFISAKPALVNVDVAGKNKKRSANGYKDTALNVEITGKGKITSMLLTDTSGKGWDTLTSNNGRWLLCVREGSRLLNSANGKVNFSVNGTKRYQLLMQDNGTLSRRNGKLILSITWGDGHVTQSTLSW